MQLSQEEKTTLLVIAAINCHYLQKDHLIDLFARVMQFPQEVDDLYLMSQSQEDLQDFHGQIKLCCYFLNLESQDSLLSLLPPSFFSFPSSSFSSLYLSHCLLSLFRHQCRQIEHLTFLASWYRLESIIMSFYLPEVQHPQSCLSLGNL